MSHNSVLNIDNFEQLLNEDNFSNLLSTLSGKDNLEDSLQSLVKKNETIVTKKTVTVVVPVKKTVVVTKKTKSLKLKKEIVALLATALYASSCVDINDNNFNIPINDHTTTTEEHSTDSTIITPTAHKNETVVEKLAHMFLIGKIITSLKPSDIDNTMPVINDRSDEDDEVKQPIVTFDTRSLDELMGEARSLLLEKNGTYDQAIADLRSIILTHPKEESRYAHELLGYAYEKSKNFPKAMKEYQTYLALYTDDDEDRTRVRQRLMSLEILEPSGFVIGKINKTREPHHGDSFDFSGSTSDYLYATSNSTRGSNQSATQVDWITGIQASLTEVHNQYTLSSKLRFTEIKDLSSSSGNRTNLTTAYVDFADTFKGYNIRLGRQSSIAGALGKFDGLSGSVKLTDDLKLSAAAGVPYATAVSQTKRTFEGVELEYNLNQDWTTGIYLNRGIADGFLERMAIGNNLEYKNRVGNILLRTEYDTVYHSLNLISLQGTYYTKNFDIFTVFERRKSPMPYGDVALNLGALSLDKQTYNSVSDLIGKSGLTTNEIYTYISQSTPIATSAIIGAREKISRNWEATIDAQVTNLSTIPGFNLNPNFDPIPIQVGDSKNYSLTAHLKGDNIFLKNNNIEFVVNDSTGGQKSSFFTVADNYKFGDKSKNSISTILRYDATDATYGKMSTVSAVLRGFYALSDKGILEAQYSRSLTKTNNTLFLNPDNTNQSFYIGYRYDF